MYRGNAASPEQDEEDAKRTRASFLQSILHPQQRQHNPTTEPFRRPQQVPQPSASNSSQVSLPHIPQVSPHHLGETRMVPLHALPADKQYATSQHERQYRGSRHPSPYSPIRHSARIGYSANPNPYDTYGQGKSYDDPNQGEGDQGIEIVTPDHIRHHNIRGNMINSHESHKTRRKREFSDYSSGQYTGEPSIATSPQKEHLSNPYVVCNCAKSRCLKLYCDCFQAGNLCNTFCKCLNCLNTSSESYPGGRLYDAKRNYMRRKPDAFGKKPKKTEPVCSCKNNKCLKKYCMCFRAGTSCTSKCVCVDCENISVSGIRTKTIGELDKKMAGTRH